MQEDNYSARDTLFIMFHCPTWGKQSFSLPVSWYFNCTMQWTHPVWQYWSSFEAL